MSSQRRHRPSLERLEERLCLSTLAHSQGSPFSLPQGSAWTQSPFMASPLFADLNNDGRDELITPVAGGALLAFTTDGDGNRQLFQVYQTGSQANIKSTPIVIDLANGDKGIFAALGRDESNPGSVEDGRVFGWNARTGAILPGWPQGTRANANNNFHTGVTGPLAAGDLTGDNVPEIVVTSFSHFVTAFRIDGSVYWEFMNNETVEGGAVIGDIDRDGRNEVVFTSGMSPQVFFPAGGLINVLNHNGTARYRTHIGELFFAAPILADLTGDGYLEIIAAPAPHFAHQALSGIPAVAGALAAGNRIYAFDHKGDLLPGWPYRTTTDDTSYHQVWKEMAAADLNGDGKIEIIAIDAGGMDPLTALAPDPRVHVVQANGQALPGWEGGVSALSPERIPQFTPWASPIVADVTGNGSPDIIVSYGAFLLGFDRFGNRLFSEVVFSPGTNLPDGRSNAAAVGQFDGKGGLELATVSNIALAPGRPSMVSIYSLPESTLTPPWPMHRRNAAGDAVQRSIPFLEQFVDDTARAVLGRSFTAEQTARFVQNLADNRFSPTLFTRAIAAGPEARGRVIDTLFSRYLDRAPRVDERVFWIAVLDVMKEVDIARALANSPEFLQRGDALGGMLGRVTLLYEGVHDRPPTPAQAAAWTNVVAQGWATYEQLVDSWLISDFALVRRFAPIFAAIGKPFRADNVTSIAHALRSQGAHEKTIAADVIATGGLYATTHSLSRWVRTAWRDIIGREANELEVAFNVREIDSGRAQPSSIARSLLYSDEGRSHFVREQYRHLLKREPSAGEVNAMKTYSRREDVIVNLVSSNEYYQRNGNNLDSFVRAAFRDIGYFNPATMSQQTVNEWVGRFNTGTPRSALASALVSSEIVVEQFFKYLPNESLGVLRTGSSPLSSPGQPINPNPGAVVWLDGVLRNTGRLEEVIAVLVATPEYTANAAYWKGMYRSRGWRQ